MPDYEVFEAWCRGYLDTYFNETGKYDSYLDKYEDIDVSYSQHKVSCKFQKYAAKSNNFSFQLEVFVPSLPHHTALKIPTVGEVKGHWEPSDFYKQADTYAISDGSVAYFFMKDVIHRFIEKHGLITKRLNKDTVLKQYREKRYHLDAVNLLVPVEYVKMNSFLMVDYVGINRCRMGRTDESISTGSPGNRGELLRPKLKAPRKLERTNKKTL
jgi:hypothetical protein